jgi:hypothetical protein
MISFSDFQDKARIGNDAGWVLTFHQEESAPAALTLRVEDYYADIEAALDSGMHGGEYTFIIEGLIDDHYKVLSRNNNEAPTVVKLHLYWRDTIASAGGYLSNVAGITDLTGKLNKDDFENALVAVLSITNVSRQTGKRFYETVIKAKERVFQLATETIQDGMCMDSTASVLAKIQEDLGFSIEPYGLNEETGNIPATGSETPATHLSYLEPGMTYRETLEEIAVALGDAHKDKRGRGMMLIRNGVLYLGPRPIPLIPPGSDPKPLMLGNGLLETTVDGKTNRDPNFDRSTGDLPPHLTKFKLTLKGRPDLKPGDVVKFDLPPEDVSQTTPSIGDALLSSVGIAGPLAPSLGGTFDHPVDLYVESVHHKLSRTKGFVTIVKGVSITNAEYWDTYSDGGSRSTSDASSSSASSSGQAAQAVQKIAQRAMATRRFAEVGEIRKMQTQGQGSETELPGQSLTIRRGLAAPDGGANQASRLPIQPSPPSADFPGIAYASPFAWGKCGLVLPRYPGTRVVMVHRNGRFYDPVEIGALWESGHGPDSQPGDWWLILPVGLMPESHRHRLSPNTAPEEHTGKVSQDLIDAEGNRIIEVGELTIRVGKDSLKNAGERPERPADEEKDSVTIEHTKEGSKIVMKPDGSVEITAKKIKFDTSQSTDGIELNAGDGAITMNANTISLDTGSSGTVEMTANTVDVSVQTSMDVS